VAVIGVTAASGMVILSASSGPIFTLCLGLLSLSLWRWANWTRVFRWALALALFGLQLVMNAPVWFIFAKINIISGSTGWHRANLIDQTVRHFSEWWLIGTRLETVESWGVFVGDITNQYVLEGIWGGLVTLVLFVWVIVVAFRTIGSSLQSAKKTGNQQIALLIWTAGAALVAHVAAFFSISYFDQNLFNWYTLLAAIAMFGSNTLSSRRGRTPGEGRGRMLAGVSV
jgi:hypothetical protein